MARIGYIRVSTQEQNTARQEEMMKGQNLDKVFIEKISGKNTERPQLKAMLDYVREGDTVIVESYSRLARNTRDLLNIVAELNEKGVAFASLKEKVDTSSLQGKLMMNIFAGIAEFERGQILQRQAEGIAVSKMEDQKRKAQGLEPVHYKGRQPIQVDDNAFKKECKAWREGKQTAVDTMKKLNLKPNTFYRRVKELGL